MGVVEGEKSEPAATAKNERPARTSRAAQKKPTAKRRKPTANLPQKPEVEAPTAKTETGFLEDLFTDDDEVFSDADFFAVDGVDSNEWRIEKRTYEKQDGTLMLYYNYRRRKGKKDPKTGKRINVYRSGGKKALS